MANQKVTQLTILSIAKITDLIYVVTYDDDGDSLSVAMSLQDVLKSAITGVNRIISGQVVWTGVGFVHQSVNLTVELNGVLYFSNGDPVTNPPPDGSNPRFDQIFFDADGLDVKEGTPAGSPTVPSLNNPTLEISTNIVLVTNGETTPTGVTLDALYSENLQESGGEWDTFESTSGARIDLANAVSPINLVVDIKANAPNALDFFNLSNSVATQIEDFQNLRFKIKSLSNWKRDYVRVEFYDGVFLAGYAFINSNTFDTTDTSTIVDLFITYGDVRWTLDFVEFDIVRFFWYDGGGGSAVSSARCQIDLVKMETGGISTKPKPSLTMDSMANMTNAKATPIDADNLTLWDSVAEQFKQLTWANFKTALALLFMTKAVYDPTTVAGDAFDTDNMAEASTGKTTPVDADTISLYDSVGAVFKKLTIANLKVFLTTLYVGLTGNQSVAGVKTFSSFPVTPSSAPTTDYQVANKKYVDDSGASSIEIGLAASDETTALTTGTAKITFRMPYAMTLTDVRASLVGAGSTSGVTTVDINESGTTVLSTKLTIDFGEKTSTTAAAAAVISDSALADDSEITIDIDVVTGGADETGLKVWLIGTRS